MLKINNSNATINNVEYRDHSGNITYINTIKTSNGVVLWQREPDEPYEPEIYYADFVHVLVTDNTSFGYSPGYSYNITYSPESGVEGEEVTATVEITFGYGYGSTYSYAVAIDTSEGDSDYFSSDRSYISSYTKTYTFTRQLGQDTELAIIDIVLESHLN